MAPGAADRPSAIPAAPPPPPQSHAVRAPGTRLPPHAPQGRPKRSGRPPGPHAGRRRPGPEGTRHGDADAGPSSGRRRRPHKAEPGSGPDGAANSVKAGEPLGEVRIDRRRAGERGTRQARSQGARGTRARGTRREGCSGKKPQARPGHQENTATGSHRHRHEGGPAAPRLGRRTALRQPTEQPLTSPGSRHQGPRSNLSHKPNTRGHTSLVSRLPPTRSRSGRPAPTRQGRSRPQGPGGPTPAPRKRGRRHRSRLGTGAGGEPARSGTLRAPAARGSLPAARTSGPARRDPPPTRKGKARATVGDEPRARPPPRGPAEPSLSLPQPRRGVKRRRRAPCKRVATAALPETQRERGGRPGDRVPQGTTSQIAREGFLTEGGSHSPRPASRPSSGPQRRSGTPGEGEGARGVRRNLRQPWSVRGQGRGPAGARARNPRGPPAVHPPPVCEAKHLQSKPTHERSEAERQPLQAAGRRTRARPEPTATAHTARAHPPEGSTGRALAGPGGALPPTWEGHISLNSLDPRTQQSSLRTHARTPRRRPEEGALGVGATHHRSASGT